MTSPGAEPAATSRSPYALALGSRRAQLDPRLAAYFSSLGPDEVGVGHGVFTTFGTPRRWLWPVLRVLGARGVLWPGWAIDVPFTAENRLRRGRLHARRTVHLPTGDWTMHDQVLPGAGGTVRDLLGNPPTIACTLAVDVDDRAVHLTSGRTSLRLGPVHLSLPAWCSPRVRLREAEGPDGTTQQVALTIDAPLLGRLYSYEGTFTDEIQREAP